MESALFTDLALSNMDMYWDNELRTLYHAAMYDFDQFQPGERKVVMDAMINHVQDNYGVDMRTAFDWGAYDDQISDDLAPQ